MRRWRLWQARTHEVDLPEGGIDPEQHAPRNYHHPNDTADRVDPVQLEVKERLGLHRGEQHLATHLGRRPG